LVSFQFSSVEICRFVRDLTMHEIW